MHRITGDGFIVDSGKNRFADEDLPSRYATQVTHQWANAVQEELAIIVEDAGGTLHASSETYAAMNQVNEAIKGRIAFETNARIVADANLQSAVNGQINAMLAQITYGSFASSCPGVHFADGNPRTGTVSWRKVWDILIMDIGYIAGVTATGNTGFPLDLSAAPTAIKDIIKSSVHGGLVVYDGMISNNRMPGWIAINSSCIGTVYRYDPGMVIGEYAPFSGTAGNVKGIESGSKIIKIG